MLLEFAKEGLPVVILCPTIVYGPDHLTHPNRIAQHMRGLLKHRMNILIDGGHHSRNLSYLDDIIRGILRAETHGEIGETYILGGHSCSHREFNERVLKLSQLRPSVSISLPSRLVGPISRILDFILGIPTSCGYYTAVRTLLSTWEFSSNKAERHLGYTRTPLDSGIQQTLKTILPDPQQTS
jgi:nucleoside-diphosphate-sugar epimerase